MCELSKHLRDSDVGFDLDSVLISSKYVKSIYKANTIDGKIYIRLIEISAFKYIIYL